MNDFVKYAIYFLLGGTIVSVSTYLGSQGRSFLAAFASTFPAITGATFILIYLNGGSEALVGYAKNSVVCSALDRLCRYHDPWRSAHSAAGPAMIGSARALVLSNSLSWNGR